MRQRGRDAVLPLPRVVRDREVNRVLGAGVEPAHLAALEPKSSVSAIPPPEQTCVSQICGAGGGGKRLREPAEGRADFGVELGGGFAGLDKVGLEFDPSRLEEGGDE